MKNDDWQIIATLHKTKNLTQASKVLYITQPALTKRLRVIEEQFNTSLFRRSNKGVEFTPAGEYLARQADKFLGLYKETLKHLNEIGGSSKTVKVLRIAAASTFAEYYLPDILKAYVEQNPNQEPYVTVDISDNIADHIEHGRAECGFVLGESHKNLPRLLFSQEQGFAVYHKPITHETLPELPLIIHNRSQPTNKAILCWFNSHYKRAPYIGMDVSTLAVALEMVTRRFGYAIVFLNILPSLHDDLFFLPLYNTDDTVFTRNTWFLYDDKAINAVAFKNFIERVCHKGQC